MPKPKVLVLIIFNKITCVIQISKSINKRFFLKKEKWFEKNKKTKL